VWNDLIIIQILVTKAKLFASSRERVWLIAMVLVLATIFAYRPAWNGGFVWDDDFYVMKNHLLTAPDGLRRIWFSLESPSQYFPLTYSSFRIERKLWGLRPTGYHWVNIQSAAKCRFMRLVCFIALLEVIARLESSQNKILLCV